MANSSIYAAFERMWQHIIAKIGSHIHDDRYYTETEIDQKLANKSDSTHNHDDKYDAKGAATTAASTALDSAKDYTDTKTSGLASTTVVDNKISTHNTSTTAHNDIRELISGLTTRLNTLANSDDTTLDQLSEIVTYIKNNKSLIDGITTSKVNVTDIVNNLTTSVANKPLSAAQGVAIKTLIDALQDELDSHTHAIADVSGLQTALDGKAGKKVTGEELLLPDGSYVAADVGAEIFNDYTNNVATGKYSHAEGKSTTATGTVSHAEGEHTDATGYASHAEGISTTASGQNSHAEGNWSEATAMSAHAEGTYTVASGKHSHAEGRESEARADYSHAEGRYTFASSECQHAQGKYNIEDAENTYAHIVGNGSSNTSRSNAHTLDWDGNAWFAGDVYVGSTSGTNKDEGSVKLLKEGDAVTKSYVDDRIDIARITTASENLNNYTSQGTYYFVDGSTPVNAPENNNNGYLVVLPSLNYIKQLWFRAGTIDATSSQTFVRTAQKGDDGFYWSSWEKFVTDADVIPVSQGGTGATDAATARTKLGITPENIGAAPTSHNQSATTITSGTLSSSRLPTVPITKGGTDATDAITAAANLGVISGKNLTETEYEIANNTDLDTVTTVGAYRIASASVAASLTNAPPITNAGFRLHVIHTTTSAGFVQMAIYNNTVPTIYARVCGSSGTWGSWAKVLTSVLRSGYDYGDTLPTAGTAGRIFFKKA